MRDAWLKVVDCVLRPARPRLELCEAQRQLHSEAQRLAGERRAAAIARVVTEIEAARAEVFAAKDGVVTPRMTVLEREWRRLSRSDRDGEVMDLWARIAPPSWIDRKRWRDVAPATQPDAAVALASDVEGVEAAEAAVGALRLALAAHGTSLPARVRWRSFERDFERTAALLERPLRFALDRLSSSDHASVALERARAIEHDVHEAARVRLRERGELGRALAHAAYVDAVWRAASVADRPNPVTPLHALWCSGYALAAVDDRAVTIELPSLSPER